MEVGIELVDKTEVGEVLEMDEEVAAGVGGGGGVVVETDNIEVVDV